MTDPPALVEAYRRLVGSRACRWLLAVTLFVGALAAVALALGLPSADRTFATVAGPVQLLMSVAVPFTGVLLASDLRRTPPRDAFAPTLIVAVALAVGVGVFGVLVSVAATAVGGSAAGGDRWPGVGTIAVGGVLVQVVAQLVGTAFGVLVRSRALACVATIVVPLGLWLALGAVESLAVARGWLTPYASAQPLLAGQMSSLRWAQWLVMFGLWGVGLNVLAATRLRSSTAGVGRRAESVSDPDA